MEEGKIWIILAVVLGSLVLTLVVVFSLFCWRRSKKRIRGFSLRAVTPLDDAEFESWRRPCQYTQRPQKYGIRPTQPAVVRTTKTPNMFEKELGNYEPPQTPSPDDHASTKSPATPIRKPERARRKSSVCSSLADRPPTPYSPASTSSEYPRLSYGSRKSYGGTPRSIHYPSMSEASAFNFDFNFNLDFDPHARDPARPSSQSDRPLNLSYGRGSYPDNMCRGSGTNSTFHLATETSNECGSVSSAPSLGARHPGIRPTSIRTLWGSAKTSSAAAHLTAVSHMEAHPTHVEARRSTPPVFFIEHI